MAAAKSAWEKPFLAAKLFDAVFVLPVVGALVVEVLPPRPATGFGAAPVTFAPVDGTPGTAGATGMGGKALCAGRPAGLGTPGC